MSYTLNRFDNTFIFVVFIAGIVRLFIAFFSGLDWISADSATYILMADAIIAGNPISYFPNGFPLFIVLIKLIFSPVLVQPALVISNVFFSTAIVAIGILLVKKSFNTLFLAVMVGLMIAFYPNQINYTRHIMTEIPTTFFLLTSTYLFLKKKYTYSAVILFLAIIFRTSLLPVIPVFLISIYFQEYRHKYFRRAFKFGSGIVICTVLFSVLIFFDVIKPSDNLNKNLLISIQSFSQDITFHVNGFSDFEKSHPFQTYFQFAIENPQPYLKQRLLSLQELWGWPSSGSSHGQRNLLAQILIFLRLPLVLLAAYKLFKNRTDIRIWILFSPILVLTLVHVPLFSMPRFNVVAEPFMIILAVLAMDEIFSRFDYYNSLKVNFERLFRKEEKRIE